MLSQQDQNHIAFRCPECTGAVLGWLGQYARLAGLLRLRCPDCSQALTLRPISDGRVSLEVPCLFCRRPHTYTVSADLLFSKDFFTLACPATGFPVLFAGKKTAVEHALEKTAVESAALLKQLPQGQEHPEYPEPDAYSVICYLLSELEAEGRVHCGCGKNTAIAEPCPGGIRVRCPECGYERTLAVMRASSAESLLSLSELSLLPPQTP